MQDRTLLGPYRALDLCNETGSLCGKIFADLGADVIKIEKPGGDCTRETGPFYHDIPHPEKSLLWFAYNTSKRGITLNLESPLTWHQGANLPLKPRKVFSRQAVLHRVIP